MRSLLATIVGLSLLFMSITAAYAHRFEESPTCIKPRKPAQFADEMAKNEFQSKVERFRICLDTFITQHNAAMAKHQSSAEKAAKIWQQFTEVELAPAKQP